MSIGWIVVLVLVLYGAGIFWYAFRLGRSMECATAALLVADGYFRLSSRYLWALVWPIAILTAIPVWGLRTVKRAIHGSFMPGGVHPRDVREVEIWREVNLRLREAEQANNDLDAEALLKALRRLNVLYAKRRALEEHA